MVLCGGPVVNRKLTSLMDNDVQNMIETFVQESHMKYLNSQSID